MDTCLASSLNQQVATIHLKAFVFCEKNSQVLVPSSRDLRDFKTVEGKLARVQTLLFFFSNGVKETSFNGALLLLQLVPHPAIQKLEELILSSTLHGLILKKASVFHGSLVGPPDIPPFPPAFLPQRKVHSHFPSEMVTRRGLLFQDCFVWSLLTVDSPRVLGLVLTSLTYQLLHT